MDVSSINNDDCYGYRYPRSDKLPLDLSSSAEKQAMPSEKPPAPASPLLMVNSQAKKVYSIAQEVIVDGSGRSRNGGEDDNE